MIHYLETSDISIIDFVNLQNEKEVKPYVIKDFNPEKQIRKANLVS